MTPAGTRPSRPPEGPASSQPWRSPKPSGTAPAYYAFAVLLTPLATDLHTSTIAVTGAFTASVLTGAALAVPIGRRLDRHGGRTLMTGGSAAGALLLVALSQVDRLWQLYLVQIGIGAAAAASLYEAAFAVVIAVTAAERRSSALLTVTVVAGFASSVFLPLTGCSPTSTAGAPRW